MAKEQSGEGGGLVTANGVGKGETRPADVACIPIMHAEECPGGFPCSYEGHGR